MVRGNRTAVSLAREQQREHSLADPHLPGPDNLARARDNIIGELKLAREAHWRGDGESERAHLGHALHGLEDSFSDGHMWREYSVYVGNPYAPVESINVFDPVPGRSQGILGTEGTHYPGFDQVPLDGAGWPLLPNHQAAVWAGTEMVEKYYQVRDYLAWGAERGFAETVGALLHDSARGVHVNTSYHDPEWQRERDCRLEILNATVEHRAPECQVHTQNDELRMDVVDGSGPAGVQYWLPLNVTAVEPPSPALGIGAASIQGLPGATPEDDDEPRALDPSAAMSVDPGQPAGHEGSGAMSVHPGQDPSAAMSVDPGQPAGHEGSGAMSVHPGQDSSAAMSVDPGQPAGHEGSGAMSVHPGQDPSAAMSVNPGSRPATRAPARCRFTPGQDPSAGDERGPRAAGRPRGLRRDVGSPRPGSQRGDERGPRAAGRPRGLRRDVGSPPARIPARR